MEDRDRPQGVLGLLHRVLGDAAAGFELRHLPEQGAETYELGDDPASGRVVLAGSTPLAQAAGLRAYLRERCGTQVTVDAPSPTLPRPLPAAGQLRRSAAFRYRYFFNFVTSAYTTAWWDWPRWERELDRLALAGVNLPLVLPGHEAVMQRAFLSLGDDRGIAGISDADLRTFLGGPAYLPFVTMGCLSGWDGPMPQRWIDEHAELGARIISRARSLGMRPVLPAFAGHVPAAVAAVARTQAVEWTGFTTHALDPRDPLFAELGERYIAAQRELFGGTDHVYAADPFIETAPPAETPDEVAAVAGAVYEAMHRADPDAVWVFQSWPFTYRDDYWSRERIDAFLAAVPDDRMLVLDLWSEHRPVTAQLDSGKPWLWCMLHNFGGRPGMYGKLDTVAKEPASSGASGIGATMEDFNNDPVCYELLADVGWQGSVDLDVWLGTWVDARYGPLSAPARAALLDAWQLLRSSVYASSSPGPSGAVMLRRPTLDGTLVPAPWQASETPRWTSVPDLVWQAWEHLATAAAIVGSGFAEGPLGRDLADVAYVAVSTLGNHAQEAAAGAYRSGDAETLRTAGATFLSTIDDLERLLATRPEYLLGRWLSAARGWGSDAAESAFYESDARRLLTVWGPPDGALVDYARRGWSGLLASFYRPRWQRWLDEVTVSLTEHATPDAHVFEVEMRAFEAHWVATPAPHPEAPEGDTFAVAETLHTTWRSSHPATPTG